MARLAQVFNYVPDGQMKLRGDKPKDWKEGDRRVLVGGSWASACHPPRFWATVCSTKPP